MLDTVTTSANILVSELGPRPCAVACPSETSEAAVGCLVLGSSLPRPLRDLVAGDIPELEQLCRFGLEHNKPENRNKKKHRCQISDIRKGSKFFLLVLLPRGQQRKPAMGHEPGSVGGGVRVSRARLWSLQVHTYVGGRKYLHAYCLLTPDFQMSEN